MTEKEQQIIARIANLAWGGYGSSKEAKQIYEICRDELGITAGMVNYRRPAVTESR